MNEKGRRGDPLDDNSQVDLEVEFSGVPLLQKGALPAQTLSVMDNLVSTCRALLVSGTSPVSITICLFPSP